MFQPTPRTPEQRRRDTLERLEHDVDAWVATASVDGTPYMVPLSFLWDGGALLVATASASPTARNLLANGRVRVGIGLVRDVVLVEGTAHATPAAEIPGEVGDAFAAKAGFDPRKATSPTTTSTSRRAGSRRGARRTSWPGATSSATGSGPSGEARRRGGVTRAAGREYLVKKRSRRIESGWRGKGSQLLNVDREEEPQCSP
ncbi:pyridoxamine 5'-phosphate oxidase family protein [Nonomuraea antimicrobica]